MNTLLSSRMLAITLPALRALRMAKDPPAPTAKPGTWAGMNYAEPEYWAARGAPRSHGDVAVISILGALSQRPWCCGMSYDGIRSSFRSAIEDSSAKAIVLEIDSPGGEVSGVDELAREIRQARGGKPIVAVSNALAASAAYYLAAQADEILVTPSGEIGSIGVYGGHMDWSGFLDQMGIVVTLVSAGEGKTDGNPFEPLAEQARADIQADVDRYYAMFVSAVTKGRRATGVTSEQVRGDWKAKVYGAKKAVEIGMADAVGTLEDAVRRAGALARDRRNTAASVDLEVEARKRQRDRA